MKHKGCRESNHNSNVRPLYSVQCVKKRVPQLGQKYKEKKGLAITMVEIKSDCVKKSIYNFRKPHEESSVTRRTNLGNIHWIDSKPNSGTDANQ